MLCVLLSFLAVVLHLLRCCVTPLHLSQTVMVSLEGLTKIVDPSQLTADFEGSLEYNHDDWIEVCPPTEHLILPIKAHAFNQTATVPPL